MIRAGAQAGAAVIVETPRSPEGLKADLEYVRAAIAGLIRRRQDRRASAEAINASAPVPHDGEGRLLRSAGRR